MRFTFFFFLTTLFCTLSTLAQEEGKRPELPGSIYDKPYIKRMGRNVAIGGYIDHEFEWTEGKDSTFDQHRFIPFIYSEITDRLHVSSEIEFEHGGLVKGSGDTDGEVKLEYAVMDFTFAEAFNYRGGVILSPLGRVNLLHDTPLNDLTARPTVNLQIMPSTLAEAGMGFFGTFYPSELAVATYEIYLVNGFNEKVNSGGKLRVRSGRGSQKTDNNQDKALVGRFGISPRLGIDLGVSFHTGKYDDAGKYRLTIIGTDAFLARGPFELQGEYGRASADDFTGSQQGAYAQTNLHFGHDYFLPESVFTAAVRWDWVDFDTSTKGDSEYGLTFGLNFRPVEDAVFKLDYNQTWRTPSNGVKGDGTGRLFFSIASYF